MPGTFTAKTLFHQELPVSTPGTAYTTPASTTTRITEILLSNNSGATRTVNIWLVESGDVRGDDNEITGGGMEVPSGIPLAHPARHGAGDGRRHPCRLRRCGRGSDRDRGGGDVVGDEKQVMKPYSAKQAARVLGVNPDWGLAKLVELRKLTPEEDGRFAYDAVQSVAGTIALEEFGP